MRCWEDLVDHMMKRGAVCSELKMFLHLGLGRPRAFCVDESILSDGWFFRGKGGGTRARKYLRWHHHKVSGYRVQGFRNMGLGRGCNLVYEMFALVLELNWWGPAKSSITGPKRIGSELDRWVRMCSTARWDNFFSDIKKMWRPCKRLSYLI